VRKRTGLPNAASGLITYRDTMLNGSVKPRCLISFCALTSLKSQSAATPHLELLSLLWEAVSVFPDLLSAVVGRQLKRTEDRPVTTEKGLYTSGAVADRVSMSRARFLYLVERGNLPAPTFQVPGRRLFTEADVLRIEAALAANPDLRGTAEAETAQSK